MNGIEKEQQEYLKFMCKLADKTREVQDDFNALSANNKNKVMADVESIIFAEGLMGLFKYSN